MYSEELILTLKANIFYEAQVFGRKTISCQASRLRCRPVGSSQLHIAA